MKIISQLSTGFILLLFLSLTPASAAKLSLYAASSLAVALQEVATAYQTDHPNDQINLNFAGSQTLATQIEQGAPADLFISADIRAMTRLHTQKLVVAPKPLLRNRLTIAVRTDLQPLPTDLDFLARRELLLAIGNPQVPIGRYTRQLFANLSSDTSFGPELIAKLKQNIVSEENRATAIVAKLLLGEVDAGVIYQTDILAHKNQLHAIALPEKHNPIAFYPAALTTSAQPAAINLYQFLLSPAAQTIFARHGFSAGEG